MWSCSNQLVGFVGGKTGTVVRVFMQDGVENIADTSWLSVSFGDCPSPKPRFGFVTVNPRVVKLYPHIVTADKSIVSQRTIENEVEYANTVFSQIGITFVCQPVVTIKDSRLCSINKHDYAAITNLYSRSAHLDGIDVYYVDKLVPRQVSGFSKRNGNKVIIGQNAVLSTLAHEIGHSFGMMDIYDYHGKKNGTSVVRLVVDGIVDADMFSPCDWNGGTGSCYYEFDRKPWVIQTFLMYGYRNETRMDIPLESVLGLIRDDSAPSGSRSSHAAIGFRGHQMHGVTQ